MTKIDLRNTGSDRALRAFWLYTWFVIQALNCIINSCVKLCCIGLMFGSF